MSVKLSAAIMAHPRRQQWAEELQQSLDLHVPIVYDENPQPSANTEQRWAVGRRCWEMAGPDADWHLVLQDDALVCDDLIAGLEVALAEHTDENGHPAGTVSPYTGTGRPDQRNVTQALTQASLAGSSWVSMWSMNWGVAVAAPVWTVADMLEWCDTSVGQAYDKRLSMYYRDVLRWKSWYTYPSLVDHRDAGSLCSHDNTSRVAHRMHGGSALSIDWTCTPARFSPELDHSSRMMTAGKV